MKTELTPEDLCFPSIVRMWVVPRVLQSPKLRILKQTMHHFSHCSLWVARLEKGEFHWYATCIPVGCIVTAKKKAGGSGATLSFMPHQRRSVSQFLLEKWIF